jgi:hypothetical protein
MSDEAMLARQLSRFKTRVALIRMGIPLKKRPHPVTDEEYQQAVAYCKCPFTDPDGTVVPGEPCPIHPSPSQLFGERT